MGGGITIGYKAVASQKQLLVIAALQRLWIGESQEELRNQLMSLDCYLSVLVVGVIAVDHEQEEEQKSIEGHHLA
jgi:hypothetical protein